MHSNIFLKNTSLSRTINLKNKQKAKIYFIVNKINCLLKNINLALKNNNEVDLYLLVLANKTNATITININHLGNNSTSNIHVTALANNLSTVKINCVSCCAKQTSKNTIIQTIDGLIFDSSSSIQALPCLDINTNEIVAKHTVNIGQVDPEVIFYLNTKGLSKLSAYQFLISNFISNFKPYLTHEKININQNIKSLIGSNYE